MPPLIDQKTDFKMSDYSLSTHNVRVGEGNGNPLQCSCLEHSRDGGAWWAAISGVAQSQTRLKRLSSSSSIYISIINYHSSIIKLQNFNLVVLVNK